MPIGTRQQKSHHDDKRILRLAGTPKASIGSADRIKFFAKTLSGVDRDWGNVGFILEELLRIHLQWTRYPLDDYLVATSLKYMGGGKTIGELDLVVIRRGDGHVVEVGQVKFSRNPRQVVRKAREQIVRFKNALRDGKVEKLKWSDTDAAAPSLSAFTEQTRHITYGCLDSVSSGFDYELDIDRDEGDAVQEMLLAGTRVGAR